MTTEELELENKRLKQEIQQLKRTLLSKSDTSLEESLPDNHENRKFPLELGEYKRYGRQMTLPEIGLKGQLKLKNSKILVIGAGGLGCPALSYLCGAGVGTLGIVDNDTVEISNLHRQIIHSSAKVGMLKTESAKLYLNQ